MFGGGAIQFLLNFMTLPESLSLVLHRYKKKFCLKFKVKMKEKDLHLESVVDFLIFIPKKSLNKAFISNHIFFYEFKNLVLQMYYTWFSVPKNYLLPKHFPVTAQKILTLPKHFLSQIQLNCI